MSFYRERFGHREGEFPVCEDVAARSVALPFFPEMTEGQVAAGRRGAGGGGRPGSIIGPWRACEPTRSAHAAAGARRVGAVGFVGAVALPIVLWHRVIADIAGEFRLDAQLPHHGLVAVGAHGARPAVLRARRASRTGATATGASTAPARAPGWAWAITLYLLGFALATQVGPDRRWPERCVSCAACVSRFREPQDPAFQAPQRVARLRPAPVAPRRRAVARARADARRAGDHRRDDGPRRAAGRPRRGRGRAARRARFPFAPDDEDIHMAVERRLTELAGPGRRQAAHRALAQRPGRHRRRALHARGARSARRGASTALMAALVDAAERHLDWPLPGYTHLQRAQPVYLAPPPARLRLDARARPRAACASPPTQTAALPLGAGRAGRRELRHRPRRRRRRARLRRASRPNSIDAVSNRDFVLDYLSAAATCATHLSRLGAELVLWSSEEFGFVELPDAWTSGSSIMPQKKNPDAAELLRAKAPRDRRPPRARCTASCTRCR